MPRLRPVPECFGKFDWYNVECHKCYWRGLCFMRTVHKERKKEQIK